MPWILKPYGKFQVSWNSILPESLVAFDVPMLLMHLETATTAEFSPYEPILAPTAPISAAQSFGIGYRSHILNGMLRDPSHDIGIKIPEPSAAHAESVEVLFQLPPLEDLLKIPTAPVDTSMRLDSGVAHAVNDIMSLQSVLNPNNCLSYAHNAHDGTVVGFWFSVFVEFCIIEVLENSDLKTVPDFKIKKPAANESAFATTGSNTKGDTLDVIRVVGTERGMKSAIDEVLDLTKVKKNKRKRSIATNLTPGSRAGNLPRETRLLKRRKRTDLR
ncbi:hypothetical protein TWF506_003050 [Arthrobotrys conoides]|uniref:Uncharacterized protein n=1 Tax=Arthrobotrys conoides TaxID=74498 RepID=A0AAN8RRC0_9PEZI